MGTTVFLSEQKDDRDLMITRLQIGIGNRKNRTVRIKPNLLKDEKVKKAYPGL